MPSRLELEKSTTALANHTERARAPAMNTPRSALAPRPHRGRRGLRLVGPAVLALARALTTTGHELVEIQIGAATADAIARIDARRTQSVQTYATHPARSAVTRPVSVDLQTATQWNSDAWQAAREGLISTSDAQALSDQLDAPGAA